MLPYDAFWLWGVVVCEFEVAGAEGVVFEEFDVKIAASGELGDRPKSSVHIGIIVSYSISINLFKGNPSSLRKI